MPRVLGALAVLLALVGAARADGPWSGTWETTWRDGGARLQLDQQGDHVTGTYPLYGGRVEAVAHGRSLDGKWFEGKESGRFLFVMNGGGNTFSGRYDSGEWWTGSRATGPGISPTFDLASPREAFRQFITNCNVARSGRPDAWGAALLAVDLGDAAAKMTRGEQLQRVQDLFAVVELATFRVWSVPADAPGPTLDIRLDQSGTAAAIMLTLVRDDKGDWRIRMPDDRQLEADRRTLLTGRGGQLPAADAYKRLQNPRDTMRSFLEGMADWSGAGRALALTTLDLSGIPEALRDAQGDLAAQYLRRDLNQIGLVGLQSIPDGSADRTPYVHFSHPAGSIVIAPSGAEPNAPWKFTRQTVADADDIYRAVEGMPPPIATPRGLIPDAPFFTLRDFVHAHAPSLLARVDAVEYWHIIGVAVLLGGAGLVGALGARLVGRWVARLSGGVRPSRAFIWSVAIAIALIVASRFATILGAPEEIRRYTAPALGTIMIVAACIAVWNLLGILGLILQRVSDRTTSATDDILFTLLVALARLGVVVAGILGVAYLLSIPTSGVIAGLSIGGLAFAFASRETLSNVFGAAILVADRPFKRGDWITSGDIEGSVEHVGIRSTRIRTAQDSILMVPNGRLADSLINNLGTRRHRLLKTQMLVTAGGTPARLEQFTAAVLHRINGDATFMSSRTNVGVAGITEAGIRVDLTTYLDVPTLDAEIAARHGLMIDIVRAADACGLTLGPGMQELGNGVALIDAWVAAARERGTRAA